MLKVSRKFSISLSIVISITFFVVCVLGAAIMPWLSEMLINARDSVGTRNEITTGGKMYVLILAYLVIAIAVIANTLLLNLLLRVKKGEVFTNKSVALIRGVSWCCFLLSLPFLLLGAYFQLAFIVTFAAIFLGICIRVVKNVIEEATQIKSENDLTV